MINRRIKTGFSLLVGSYLGMVVFNNVTDYDTNFQFVTMVAKMSDVFSAPRNNWRHVDAEIVHHAFYIGIILLELVIAALLLLGAYRMKKSMDSDAEVFLAAKRYTSIGLSLGVFLWFFVFLTVGGEWYLMWQSEKWNAQGNAFFLTATFLLFLIFHSQPDN